MNRPVAMLPSSGRIACNACYCARDPEFGITARTAEGWRITANPLAWGSTQPEVLVLGFSKGPTQLSALAATPHDDIAYKGSRHNVGRILEHVGLLDLLPGESHKQAVHRVIADRNGRFHFGSLIRCSVERRDDSTDSWKGSGGGMLDRFIATSFGRSVAENCVARYLGLLPQSTKLIVMFGTGSRLNYVSAARSLFERARPRHWRTINDVAYSDGEITVVHVEHFASQGALVPNWLGQNRHPRRALGEMARDAVRGSGIALAGTGSNEPR